MPLSRILTVDLIELLSDFIGNDALFFVVFKRLEDQLWQGIRAASEKSGRVTYFLGLLERLRLHVLVVNGQGRHD